MRVFLEYTLKNPFVAEGDASEQRQQLLGENKSPVRELTHFLAEQLRWESVEDEAALTAIANEMAVQLPPTDLDGFFTHLVTGMTLKSPRSVLTIGYLFKDDVARIRIRILCSNTPEVAPLGRKVATATLQRFASWKLTDMEIWESRKTSPVLEGKQSDARGFRRVALERIELTALLVIAIAFLISGYVLSWVTFKATAAESHSRLLLGDHSWTWYTRLFGPMISAALASLIGLLADWRRTRVRSADWTFDI